MRQINDLEAVNIKNIIAIITVVTLLEGSGFICNTSDNHICVILISYGTIEHVYLKNHNHLNDLLKRF